MFWSCKAIWNSRSVNLRQGTRSRKRRHLTISQETLNFWKQLTHIMKYFRKEEDPTARLPKNFISGFLEVRQTFIRIVSRDANITLLGTKLKSCFESFHYNGVFCTYPICIKYGVLAGRPITPSLSSPNDHFHTTLKSCPLRSRFIDSRFTSIEFISSLGKLLRDHITSLDHVLQSFPQSINCWGLCVL